jgi:hypothetical protein
VIDAAFDMQTEVANLAERIIGPVAVNLAQRELNAVLGEIRNVFEQLSTKGPVAHVDFKNVALNILEPVRAKLSEADFSRIIDRLRGAMIGFCQRDEAKAQPNAEPWWLQQAGENAQSVRDSAEPWWSTSEEAILLIILWLCTEIYRQLR